VTFRGMGSTGLLINSDRTNPVNATPMALVLTAIFFGSLSSWAAEAASAASPDQGENIPRSFMVKGVVEQLKADSKTIVIRHEAISNYMDAMTMPFKVKEPKELVGLQTGDEISFRLQVTSSESWIDGIVKSGSRPPGETIAPAKVEPPGTPGARKRHPLMDYKFTNELGQAVSLGDFHGQALALTFFFTRCPIPDYCPRLSKNFQAASEKLNSTPGGPTNWHFLSVTFDPEVDNPQVLKAYAEQYHYDPAHWSFLTGPSEQVSELARQSDVKFDHDGAFYNHNFRTLIIDAAGHVQMIFPMGGDLSDAIVDEMRKAIAPNAEKSNTEH
jgi:protein SCO1/2